MRMTPRRKPTLAEQHTALAHQFDDLTQQHEASSLGMWAFLLTEIMFFGGLFAGYTVYRTAYAAGFVAGGQHLHILLRPLHTAVLICRSPTTAPSGHAAPVGQARLPAGVLVLAHAAVP